MGKAKLSFEDLKQIDWALSFYVLRLDEKKHDHRCMAHCLLDAKIRNERKMLGLINKKGYTLKINDASVEAIYYIRNDLHIFLGGATDNAVIKLLEMNK